MRDVAGIAIAGLLGLSIALAATKAQAQAQAPWGGILVPGSEETDKPDPDYKPEPKDDAAPGNGSSDGSGGSKPKPKEDTGPADESGAQDDGKKYPNPGDLEGRVKSLEQRMREARNNIRTLRSQVQENARAIEELRMLLEEDRNMEPKPGEGITPLVVDCKGEEGCLQCLRPLEQELGELLRLFERLRVIYADYKGTHDTAVSIGDSLSGLHQAAGAAWAQVKVGMEIGLRKLQDAYDAKFNELMNRYQNLLERADRCLPEGTPPVSNSVSARSMKALLALQYKRSG